MARMCTIGIGWEKDLLPWAKSRLAELLGELLNVDHTLFCHSN